MDILWIDLQQNAFTIVLATIPIERNQTFICVMFPAIFLEYVAHAVLSANKAQSSPQYSAYSAKTKWTSAVIRIRNIIISRSLAR